MAAAKRPNRGQVSGPISGTTSASALAAARARGRRDAVRNGSWRPDRRFAGADGIKISLRHEKGVTTGDVLRVPMRFQGPVLNDFARPYLFNWATFSTLRLGERSRPDGRQLLAPSIDTILMDGPTSDASSGIIVWDGPHSPQRVIRELLWIMGYTRGATAQVFRLVIDQPAVWGAEPLINMLATLNAMTPTQKSGSVGTEYVSLGFLEFAEDTAGRKQRPSASGSGTHTLRAGDTLYEIAKNSTFRAASAWRVIAHANGITGVSPSSASELAAWAKRHHKTELTIPALSMGPISGTGTAGGL